MPLLLFILVWPLAEIWLMIQVGQQTGAFSTLLLIIATAALGLILVQLEWQRLMLAMRDKMHRGEATLGVVLETAAVGLAGVLLFIPGFISDFLGLLLLLPLTRRLLLYPLKKNNPDTNYQEQDVYYYQKSSKTQQQDNLAGSGRVLEGEYKIKDEKEP